MNKLVKGNLIRGLPSKLFENNQTCVACQKGKQHRASCKSKTVSSISQPLHMLHMDLFGPTFVKSLLKKMYCLVVTDDYSRFSWVFFLATKDETGGILKSFKTRVENLINQRVKAAAINTACYVQNRVLVTKPHNKTPYELFLGRKLALGFMRPCGYLVTILNTIDHLGKFDGKADEGFFVGYSINSKAFRVFNNRTRIVEENLHVQFSDNIPNIARSGPNWLFDIDALTKSMNYKPVVEGNQSNGNAGTKARDDAGKARMDTVPDKDYILLPLWITDPPFSQNLKSSPDARFKSSRDDEKKVTKEPRKEGGDPSKEDERDDQKKDASVNSTNNVNAASTNKVNDVDAKTSIELPLDLNMPELEDYSIFKDDEDVGAEADMNNLDTTIQVSPILTTRIHKDHPLDQVIRDLQSAPQTRRMSKNLEAYGFKEAMQEELLQFKLQEVWTLVALPNGKRAIGTKWVFRNKKDERGIVIKNKARLVAQGYTQEERIDYDEVFTLVARIEAIRLFLTYASFKDSVVYQMDVKSAFLYGKIEEEVYVCQPPGFEDPDFPDRVYKIEKALYGLHQGLRSWYETLSTYLLDNGFQRGKIDKTLFIRRYKGLQVKQKEDGIFISQDKYVTEILKKFGFTDVKTTSTPMETKKLLLKDEDVCTCARYQVNPKVSHLHTVKRIFRYLKGQPKLGLWYPKDSPFDLVAYTNSDYARTSLDKKSTTGRTPAGAKLMLLVILDTAKLMMLVILNIAGIINIVKIMRKRIERSASVRSDLQLDDEEGMDYLPNATIFEELTRIGAKTTAWNEFSSIMASAIICLATNQKFNFSKYIFESMVKNLENVSGEGLANPTDPHHTPTIIQPSTSQPQKKQRSRRSKRKDTEVPQPSGPTTNVADEAVNEEMDDSLERATTIATGLEAEQESGNIDKTQFKATLNEPSSLGTSSCSGPRRQETMGDTIAQTGFENVSKTSNDLLLAGVNTPQSDEDSLKLKEFMELYTNLQNRVIDLEKTKTFQAQEITSLKRRIKRLEKKGGSRTHGLKRLYKVGLSRRVESSDEEVTTHFDADTNMFRVHDLVGDEVVVEREVAVKAASTIPVSAATTTTTVITNDEITLAKALAELKSAKLLTTTAATTITAMSTRPRVKRLVIQEQEQAPTPTVSLQQPSQLYVQDKGKGKMVESEPVKKLSKKDQLMLDEELAFKLQAEEEEEDRLVRQREEEADIVSWDNVQAMIDADY
ncbi:putative ribonuclease H-like domain-containing protein [Tanacetum coccineum]|uniref:Ribonuclease H-like domain-containing protein n=1 Tax=Tanacetum coccineum TaxID=301880 RepID=A0ABQ5F1E9_9ASTR